MSKQSMCTTAALLDDVSGCAAPAYRQQELNPNLGVALYMQFLDLGLILVAYTQVQNTHLHNHVIPLVHRAEIIHYGCQ